jgi:hypothetical protein
MAPLFRTLSRRDAILILIGAFSMHFFTSLAPLTDITSHSIVINTGVHHHLGEEAVVEHPPKNNQELGGLLGHGHILEESNDFPTDSPEVDPHNGDIPSHKSDMLEQPTTVAGGTDLSTVDVLPETTIVEHVPGWTLFRDIYMANGTLLILSSSPTAFPDIRYMTSTGLAALNTPENIALREPTPWNMDFVSPEEAIQRWGDRPGSRRVWSVEGNTVSLTFEYLHVILTEHGY